MSNWHNDNWSSNDSAYMPVEVIPLPIRRVMRFSFRLYVLAACVGAFGWSIYATIQAVHKHSANTYTSRPTSAPHFHQPQPTKGKRP